MKERGGKRQLVELVERELGASEAVLENVVLILALDGPRLNGSVLGQRSSSLTEDSMRSAIKVEERGVKVEEATRVLSEPLAVVKLVLAVLHKEHGELVQTFKSHKSLTDNVVVTSEAEVAGVGGKDSEGHGETVVSKEEARSSGDLHSIDRDKASLLLLVSSCAHDDGVVTGHERHLHHHGAFEERVGANLLQIEASVDLLDDKDDDINNKDRR